MSEEKTKEEKEEEITWNVLRQRGIFVSRLIWKTTEAMLKYDFKNGFASLKELRELINPELTSPQQKRLDEIEKRASTLVVQWSDLIEEKVENSTEFMKKNFECNVIVTEYRRWLMEYLKEQGYFSRTEQEDKSEF